VDVFVGKFLLLSTFFSFFEKNGPEREKFVAFDRAWNAASGGEKKISVCAERTFFKKIRF
jgi:hypothetical protein